MNGVKKWDAYKVKISILLGLIGFLINLIPIDVTINAIKFSIIPGIFTAFFIAQIWGLKYGLLTALCGSTQTMWFLWITDGYGIFYSVPVYTIWIIWHGFMSDRRKTDSNYVWFHNKFVQEFFIRVLIEFGFWTIFPWLISLNPPPWVEAPTKVSTDFLLLISIKHTAVPIVMMLLTDVITSINFVKKLFKIEKNEKNRFFLIPLIILWSVFFWIFDASMTKIFFSELKAYFSTTQPLTTMELMFIDYPVTNFFVRIIFAVFMIAAALIIYDFYRKERRSNLTFKKIFENSKDIIFLVSSNGTIHKINKAGKSLLAVDDRINTIDEILIPDSAMRIGQLIVTHEGEARFLAKFISTSQKTFDCMTSCIDRDKDEYLLMGRDITETLKMNEKLKSLNENLLSSFEELEASYEEIEQKSDILEEKNRIIEKNRQDLERAFNKMKTSEERFEKLYRSNEFVMQSIPEMIVRFNKRGDIQWLNRAFKQRFELSNSHNNIEEIKINEVPLMDQQTLTKVWSKQNDKLFTMSLGEELILNVVTVPAVEQDEMILIMHDITKIKMREEYYKSAKKAADEAAAMKDEFIAKISHELRTPMNGIITASNLINDMQTIDNPEVEEYLSIIYSSSKRLMSTINELLDISKLEKGQDKVKLELIDLYQLFNTLKRDFIVFAKQKKLELTIAFEGDVPRRFYTDREKITHILSNLIFNAIKFTSEGFVKLLVKGRRIDLHHFDLTFFVMDSGIGIPKDKQEDVFEKFSQVDNSYTREFEGTGLGLAISQGIAKVLNSKIKLQSEPGKGTTFYFNLIVKEGFMSSDERDKTSDNDLNKLEELNPIIFVAEDDPVSAKLLSKSLKRFGCQVKLHHNAYELLETLKTEIPDIILMDIQMPGINGIDATTLIKSNSDTKHVPIIALSAHAFAREKEKSFKSGMCDYLTKPIDQKLLLETLLKNLK